MPTAAAGRLLLHEPIGFDRILIERSVGDAPLAGWPRHATGKRRWTGTSSLSFVLIVSAVAADESSASRARVLWVEGRATTAAHHQSRRRSE